MQSSKEVVFESGRIARKRTSRIAKYEIAYILLILLGLNVNTLFLYTAIFIALICFLMTTPEENYYFSLFIIPGIRIFDSLGTSYIINLLLLIPIILFFIKHRKVRRPSLAAAFLGIYEVLHFICYENIGSLLTNVITFLVLIYGWSLSTNTFVRIKKIEMTHSIARGVIFSSICYLLTNPTFIVNWMQNIGAERWRFEGYSGDPNALALYSLVALSLVISTRSAVKYSRIVALSIIVLLTFSKMGIIILTFNMIVFVILNIKNGKSALLLLLIPATMFILIATQRELVISILGGFTNRFTGGVSGAGLNKITSGRFEIDAVLFQRLFSSPLLILFGASMNYPSFLGINYVAHSTYFDVVLSWGILGIVLIGFIMIKWGKQCARHKTVTDRANLLPLVTLALCLLTLSFLSASMFWYIVTCTFLCIDNNPA